MSIKETKTIDFISREASTDEINLSISDHLDWNDPKNEHLLILQEKINSYLTFIESGQLYEDYPLAKNKKINIQVIGKFPLNEEAKKFYAIAGQELKRSGYHLIFSLLEDNKNDVEESL